MRTNNPLGSSMTEDTAIAIDRTTLQSVYTCTHPGIALGRCTADRAHPTVRTLGSYGPILHPALKTVQPRKGRHQDCEMPPCGHTGVPLRGWTHLHLSPTDTPLSSWKVWFRTCRAQLGPNPTLGRVVCTLSPVKWLAHSVLDRGKLISSKRK
jgi:hypothetical protein